MITTQTATALSARIAEIMSAPEVFAAATKSRKGGGTWGARLLDFLTDYAGVCAYCGLTLDRADAVACHIIPATLFGRERGGYLPGNLFAGHADCNSAQSDASAESHLDKIDHALVPLTWTLGPKRETAESGAARARREARQANGWR
jgi:hypothetical protein